MPDWLQNSHATYVLAAYALAALFLIGLGLLSWRAYVGRSKEWQKISQPSEPR